VRPARRRPWRVSAGWSARRVNATPMYRGSSWWRARTGCLTSCGRLAGLPSAGKWLDTRPTQLAPTEAGPERARQRPAYRLKAARGARSRCAGDAVVGARLPGFYLRRVGLAAHDALPLHGLTG